MLLWLSSLKPLQFQFQFQSLLSLSFSLSLNLSNQMATSSSLCLTQVCSFKSSNKPGLLVGNSGGGKVVRVNEVFQCSKAAKSQSWEIKATDDGNKSTVKVNSLVCTECEGNGAKVCSQCKGTGVNAVDHFNGQYKAGGLCWLCRGKREILCGECNGAGFLGGFMSTHDA